jgi:hypothetical protein
VLPWSLGNQQDADDHHYTENDRCLKAPQGEPSVLHGLIEQIANRRAEWPRQDKRGPEQDRTRPCCSEDSGVDEWYTSVCCSHGPDIVRASEPEHLVQDPGGDGDLGRLGLVSPRP